MEIEKLLSAEQLADQNEKGEQKIYVLPDAEADSKQNEILLDDTTNTLTLSQSMAKVEQVLGEYLAMDGEQKVYVLPDDLDVEQLLGRLTGIKTGEIKQSQMWRKTDVRLENKEQSKMMAAMDQRIKRLEFLLKQTTGLDVEVMDKEIE